MKISRISIRPDVALNEIILQIEGSTWDEVYDREIPAPTIKQRFSLSDFEALVRTLPDLRMCDQLSFKQFEGRYQVEITPLDILWQIGSR